MDLLTPISPGGLPTLSLTTNSSWLPWERVAMPLISPLMPVPQSYKKNPMLKIYNLCKHIYIVNNVLHMAAQWTLLSYYMTQ